MDAALCETDNIRGNREGRRGGQEQKKPKDNSKRNVCFFLFVCLFSRQVRVGNNTTGN